MKLHKQSNTEIRLLILLRRYYFLVDKIWYINKMVSQIFWGYIWTSNVSLVVINSHEIVYDNVFDWQTSTTKDVDVAF